jgi:hypothetical protein
MEPPPVGAVLGATDKCSAKGDVMSLWPSKRVEDPDFAGREDLLDAYKNGRKDERLRVKDTATVVPDEKADLREVYERGRRDERARHRSSPVIGLLLLLVAAAGGTVVYLAVREGSFTNGGAVVDRTISAASDKAQAPIRHAADSTGAALENAGETLKKNAGTDNN